MHNLSLQTSIDRQEFPSLSGKKERRLSGKAGKVNLKKQEKEGDFKKFDK